MTQEQLAELLGVGRTFVTRVVEKFRSKNVIATRRGRFIILDEAALQGLACECTRAIQEHFDTVLHGIYPTE
jgi:DNA-binding FadR family transcriptional regulator